MAINFTYSFPKKPLKFSPCKAYLLKVSYLAEIVNACESIIDEASRNPSRDKFGNWFGKKNDTDLNFEHSKQHVNSMLGYVRSTLLELESIQEATIAKTDQSDPRLRIGLGTRFSMDMYSFGERVVTFLHEISHKTTGLKTKDELYKGNEAYKGVALDLANDNAEFARALKNAENWAYYLASYHVDANLGEGEKWKYTTSKVDIESRKLTANETVSEGRGVWQGYWLVLEPNDCGCVQDGTNLPITKYLINGTSVTYERGQAPSGTSSSPVLKTVVHVTKAAVNSSNVCTKCGKQFPSPLMLKQHQNNDCKV
jgi:hypothetical protein